jgi:enhancer of mRNA-decapping protein 3
MSDLFIGLTMLVTLSSPPGAQLRGKVSSVLAGQSLTLRDGTFSDTSPCCILLIQTSTVYLPANGKTITEITVKASDISDLVEATDENFNPAAQLPVEVPTTSNPKSFEDPAILRVGRRPTFQGTTPSPVPAASKNGEARRLSTAIDCLTERDITPAAILVDPMKGLGIANRAEEVPGNGSEAEQHVHAEKRTRKRRVRKGGRQATANPEAKDSVSQAIPVTETNRTKGWRQTPLLEPNPSFQPFSTLKKKPRKGAYDNGWATEDATDVQDMGDFDFEANLSKFDKRTVFEGIRTDDMTADEDRLVGHNRLTKAGAAAGKNLHHTENVLDDLNAKATWNSEAELSDAENVISHRDTGSGRTSRRAESRMRKPLVRKDTSVNSSQRAPASQSPASPKSGFYLVPANRRCEVVSSLQMLNLENIADSELGLTEDMMTENAARGIAEVALSALNAGGRRLTQDNSSIPPYVIVYAGNNKSGLRAVAAGRHLRNHGINVAIVVLGLEREPELLEGLRRQLKIFRSFGGKVFTKVELLDYIKSLDAPIDLIIDGLLGLTISFEELRTGDQATAYELIAWANRSKANTLAIDIPTGIDPTSGKVSIIDGTPLYIHAKYVVAIGAPKKGLLQAMSHGEGVGDSRAWQLFVADIGIANQAWRKAGTRMRRGVEFEGTWVVGMRFQKGVD